jgi:hypothetical protein
LAVFAEAVVLALSAARASDEKEVLAAKVAAPSKNSRRFAAIGHLAQVVYTNMHSMEVYVASSTRWV